MFCQHYTDEEMFSHFAFPQVVLNENGEAITLADSGQSWLRASCVLSLLPCPAYVLVFAFMKTPNSASCAFCLNLLSV